MLGLLQSLEWPFRQWRRVLVGIPEDQVGPPLGRWEGRGLKPVGDARFQARALALQAGRADQEAAEGLEEEHRC